MSFCCETCGRDERDLPRDDTGDVAIFNGDDGSCCREVRQRLAHAYVVVIIEMAMRAKGRLR